MVFYRYKINEIILVPVELFLYQELFLCLPLVIGPDKINAKLVKDAADVIFLLK